MPCSSMLLIMSAARLLTTDFVQVSSGSGGGAVKEALDKVRLSTCSLPIFHVIPARPCEPSIWQHACALNECPMQVLIADFFFICAALAWLVAGVGAKTLFSNSVGMLGLLCAHALKLCNAVWWKPRIPCKCSLQANVHLSESSEVWCVAAQALIDAWFPLWQWVFQPAIGILMLGALASGAVGQLQKGSDKGS